MSDTSRGDGQSAQKLGRALVLRVERAGLLGEHLSVIEQSAAGRHLG